MNILIKPNMFTYLIKIGQCFLILSILQGEPELSQLSFDLDKTVLTEQDVVEKALVYNRKLKSYKTNEEIAEYKYKKSNFIRNPELRFRDISTRYYTTGYDEVEIGLRWSLPELGELGEKRQRTVVNHWERKVRKDRFQQKLTARVRRDYATVLMWDQQVELANQRVLKEDERIQIIEKLVEVGDRSVVYFTKAKMWHAEAKHEYSRAIQKQNLVRKELSNESGISEQATLLIADLPEIKQSVDELIQLAYKNRPEIGLVQQRIKLTMKENYHEKLKRVPWITYTELTYHREKFRQLDWGEIKFGIHLPLLNWNSGNIKATNLAVKKKEYELEATEESIKEEVQWAYTVYKDLLLDWKNFHLYANELIENAEKVIEQSKEHQVLMPDEVIEMELTILEDEKLLCRKRRDLAHALIDLYYAIGIESHEELLE